MSILKKISVLGLLFVMSILFLAPVYADAATVGNALTSPETGWQRIDDIDSNINYSSSWLNTSSATDNAKRWGGTGKHCFGGNESIMTFKFYGTKLRLIGELFLNRPNDNIIIIDDVQYTFSENGTATHRALVYEKSELELGIHTVIIKPSASMTSSQNLVLDAIDIDDTGYLIPFSQTSNLTATAGDSAVNLTWVATEGASSYNVKRATTSGGPYTTITTTTKKTYEDTGLTNGMTYYYVVSTIDTGIESTDSNEVSATPTGTPTPNVTALKVVLEVDEELQLSVDDDLDVNLEMIWTSSDNTVATVDGNGVVTALKPGNTVVTVVSKVGTFTNKINVLVVENADNYRIAVDLKVGKSCRLTVDDLTDTVKFNWNSLDLSIATVSSKGKVTATGEGLTVVIATDEEGNEIGQIYIRVRE